LYDFVNSIDLRRFVHHGVQHTPRDELETPGRLAEWMASRGLLRQMTLSKASHARALRLRAVLRSFIQLEPGARRGDQAAAEALNEIAGDFPLSINLDAQGTIDLLPARREEVSGLGAVLAELERAATRGRLDRLKMCASAECLWIFYDRSKPGSRRWCVSLLCGNREKTRAYRRRHQDTP